ncbi:restriction endonuclease subunit S, partial [Salmonella enterica subsp. enterica serovar Typhimurium]|nr:restriction endonuclease subunit S [Salmonella enterica subsp. enterica serovar Typhimurium]
NKRRILVQETAIDNNCLGIKPCNAISGEWFYLILSALDMSKYQSGTSIPAINQSVIGSIPIALPSLKMQEKILSYVITLMSLCDQLELHSLTSLDAHQQLVETLLTTLTDSQNADELAENWARISEHFDTLFTTEASIDALKQTILQLAVMGKLVPQDPNDEPASELLKRIAAEKAELMKQGKIKKQKPLPEISEEEKPFELPVGWEWTRLINLGTWALGSG